MYKISNIQYAFVTGLAVMLCVVPAPSNAQETADLEQRFQEQLAERDAIIIGLQHSVAELRERVAALESRLQAGGSEQSALPQSAPSDSLAMATMPAPESSGSDSSRLVVDEIAAERALERTLVQAGALLLPRGAFEISPFLSIGVSDFELPTTVETEAGTESALASVDLTSYSLGLTGRIGLPFESQLEIGIPYQSVTEETVVSNLSGPVFNSKQTGRGTGDLLVGVSKTLLREGRFAPDVIGRVTWSNGQGSETDNGVLLGGGFQSLSGSLSLVKRKDPMALFLSLGYQAFDKQGGTRPGDAINVSFGTGLAVSPDSSLFGSVTHRSISETEIAGESIAGSDLDITSLTIGYSTILRRGTLLNLYSEVGMSDDAPDYAVGFSVPIRVR